ncbi:hypothetical protein Tco_0843789 [Tanacetum coccineum]
MLEKCFIRPSVSRGCHTGLFVKKKDGSMRLCIDYRELNRITIRNDIPLPANRRFGLSKLQGAKIFSKIELAIGYQQLRWVNESKDISKTAFRTCYGHYEFLWLCPIGQLMLCRVYGLMNRIFTSTLISSLLFSFDDILFTPCLEVGMSALRIVMRFLDRRSFLLFVTGHHYGSIKVEAYIHNAETYYGDRKFVGGRDDVKESFEELKRRLVSAPILTLPSGSWCFPDIQSKMSRVQKRELWASVQNVDRLVKIEHQRASGLLQPLEIPV